MKFGTVRRKCEVCGHTKTKGCPCANLDQNCPVCKNFNFFCMTRTATVYHIRKCMQKFGLTIAGES